MIDDFHDLFFKDSSFIKYYTKYLREMSNKDYLDNFFNHIDEDLLLNISKIHKSYPKYSYSNRNRYISQDKVSDFLEPKKPFRLKLTLLKNSYDKKYSIDISNNSFLPIKIISYSINGTNENINIDRVLKPKIPTQNLHYEFLNDGSHHDSDIQNTLKNGIKIKYHVLGLPNEQKIFEIFESDIIVDKAIEYLVNDFPLEDNKYNFIDLNGDSCIIKNGNWTIDEPLIIPAGLKFIIRHGTRINLINSALIVSYSPLFFIGKSNNPIIIESSDKTGQGIICIDAGTTSKLSNVVFDKLKNPSLNGWKLTGSVFYASKVGIFDCTFSNNYCEDALNIISTDFEIKNTKFENIFSDAFDGDFANGSISNSVFYNIVNDAIDISGGFLKADGININKVGDKGFSAGKIAIF